MIDVEGWSERKRSDPVLGSPRGHWCQGDSVDGGDSNQAGRTGAARTGCRTLRGQIRRSMSGTLGVQAEYRAQTSVEGHEERHEQNADAG